jgi:hypothetical protein
MQERIAVNRYGGGTSQKAADNEDGNRMLLKWQ